MPENFDIERQTRIDADRDFIIGGETLRYRASVPPELMIEWSKVEPSTTDEANIPLLDELMQQFVTEDSWPKWQRIRAVTDDYALNLDDITKVLTWLVERQTGRPTEPSSDSPDGSPTTETGTPSTDASPSPAPTPPHLTSVV